MLLKGDLNSQPWEKLAVHDCGHFPVLRHLGLCNKESDHFLMSDDDSYISPLPLQLSPTFGQNAESTGVLSCGAG